jgi:hypothetical protein
MVRVLHKVWVEYQIEGMPTLSTKTQTHITLWGSKGLLTRWPEEIAVDGYLWYLDKNNYISRVANWANAF